VEIKGRPELLFTVGCWTPGSGTDGESPGHGSSQAGQHWLGKKQINTCCTALEDRGTVFR
jgi:hypothetical protein